MNDVIIKAATHIAVRAGTEVYEYIRDDQSAKCGLVSPVRIVIEGPGVGCIDFPAPDKSGTIISPTINRCELSFQPFPALESWWNGPDVIPNKNRGGRIPGSLAHDFICHFIRMIAQENGLTEDEVWEWASGILAVIWEHYGHYDAQAKRESWIAYHATRLFRRPYKVIQRLLGFASIIMIALTLTGCSGCQAIPDWRVTAADPVIWVENGVTQTNTPPASPLQGECN
jgi:hypothetical protein